MRILRTATTSAATAALLVLLAVPAWARPSFTSGGAAEAGAASHQVTMQVPEDDRIGTTTTVVLTAPTGFGVNPDGCFGPVGWSCAIEGRRVTWSSSGLAALGAFGFSVRVTSTPGDHAFPVTQTDAEGASVAWPAGAGAPVMTVTGASPSEDPSPTSDPAPSPAASPSPASPTPQDGDGADAATPAPAATSADDDAAQVAAQDDEDATPAEDEGSTAPRRTQGRSRGTTLEITPSDGGDAGVDGPAVADDPAVAPPPSSSVTDAVAQDADTTAAGPVTADEGEGRPWQQVVGGVLLLAGAGIVGVRRWRAAA